MALWPTGQYSFSAIVLTTLLLAAMADTPVAATNVIAGHKVENFTARSLRGFSYGRQAYLNDRDRPVQDEDQHPLSKAHSD